MVISDDLLEVLRKLDEISPLRTLYVANEKEIDASNIAMDAKGYKLASISNTGLKTGLRLTYIKEEELKKGKNGP